MTLHRRFAAAALVLLATTAAVQLRAVPSRSAKATAAHSSSHAKSAKASHGRTHHNRKPRGQQAIEPERVIQIQTALIRAHYLRNDPNGEWDATTIAAMQKYQADNNWQTKLMPDSRALIKLGLGPDYSNAVNASSASFVSTAAQPQSASTPQAEGFIEASGIRQ